MMTCSLKGNKYSHSKPAMQGDTATDGNKARYGPGSAHNFSARLAEAASTEGKQQNKKTLRPEKQSYRGPKQPPKAACATNSRHNELIKGQTEL